MPIEIISGAIEVVIAVAGLWGLGQYLQGQADQAPESVMIPIPVDRDR